MYRSGVVRLDTAGLAGPGWSRLPPVSAVLVTGSPGLQDTGTPGHRHVRSCGLECWSSEHEHQNTRILVCLIYIVALIKMPVPPNTLQDKDQCTSRTKFQCSSKTAKLKFLQKIMVVVWELGECKVAMFGAARHDLAATLLCSIGS